MRGRSIDVGGCAMPSQGQALEVAWLAADGQQRVNCPALVQIEVVAGLLLDLVFSAQEAAGIIARVTLSGERPGCGSPGKSNARFVVIPLDAASLLLGVAEPSAEPAAWIP